MQYDAAIIGGGLVGSSIALALADAGHQIAVIDAKPAIDRLPEQLDLRVVALSNASLAWLKHIKIFSQLRSERLNYFTNITVCEEDTDSTLEFSAEKMVLDYLGIIVENQHVLYTLQQRVLQHKNIASHFSYALQSRDDFGAKLTIGADGGNSWLREQLGITSQQKDYQQRALVCYVKTQTPHKNTAWQRFLPTGPIALLPMHDQNLCSIVWTLPNEDAQQKQALTLQALSAVITEATGENFGEIHVASKAASFPLRMQHAHQYGHDACILLGDAIHTIHPLAGQGVNLGFADARDLFTLLNKTDSQHWGKDLLRQKFERSRRTHNAVLAHGMSIFLNEKLRHRGMQLFRHSDSLKKIAMQVALG